MEGGLKILRVHVYRDAEGLEHPADGKFQTVVPHVREGSPNRRSQLSGGGESAASERVTSRSRRAGNTALPWRSTSQRSGTRSPISMSVARSSGSASSEADIMTPERAWTALRVDATRVTV